MLLEKRLMLLEGPDTIIRESYYRSIIKQDY